MKAINRVIFDQGTEKDLDAFFQGLFSNLQKFLVDPLEIISPDVSSYFRFNCTLFFFNQGRITMAAPWIIIQLGQFSFYPKGIREAFLENPRNPRG